MKKPKSSEGVSIDKNATYQPSAGFQPDWNAKHYAVKKPTPPKDWGKKADTAKPLKKAPVSRRDIGRSR